MSLCMGCMHDIGDEKLCPECGFDNNEKQPEPFLDFNTKLKNRYIIGRGIDTNGESTRYLGFDTEKEDKVIIREFLPIGMFDRKSGEKDLTIAYNDETVYKNLKNNYLSYYRIVQELNDMSAVIKILDIFEENNTAYVVEEYLSLTPFDEYVKQNGGQLEWESARPMLLPLISALESLHKRGQGHYAVSPSNLFVTSDGKIKLSGFCTAMERKRGTPLKSQLYSGCAAPEQYENNFTLDIVTEIYGFTATLFYTLTGHAPANAKERIKDSRLLMSTNTVKRLPPHVVTALANGLQMDRRDRISDFDELRSQLSVAPTAQAIQEEISKTAGLADVSGKKETHKKNNTAGVTALATVIALVIFVGLGVLLVKTNVFGLVGKNNDNVTSTTTTAKWNGPTVDNFIGKKYSEVKNELKNSNQYVLNVAYDEEFNDEVAEGCICAQTPAPGTPITDKNAEVSVSITISKGKKMRTLPKISGKTVDSVAKTLSKQGLLVMQETEYSNKYANEIVVDYKDLKAGDQIEYGKTVTIRVSMGQEQASSTSPIAVSTE
ncbi:MAG: PASTA domain-containing protein [Ruminococcus sp.]|nr:PASTA domain-containing protein [Ruminococcus sp.]